MVVISQHHPCCPFQQHIGTFSVRFTDRSQKYAGQHTKPTHLSMQTKSIKSLSIRMVFVIASYLSEGDTLRDEGKLTYRNWDAVYDGQTGAELITSSHNQHHTCSLMIHRLAALRTKIVQSTPLSRGKKVRRVLAKVVKKLLFLRQARIAVNYFRHDRFTLRPL